MNLPLNKMKDLLYILGSAWMRNVRVSGILSLSQHIDGSCELSFSRGKLEAHEPTCPASHGARTC